MLFFTIPGSEKDIANKCKKRKYEQRKPKTPSDESLVEFYDEHNERRFKCKKCLDSPIPTMESASGGRKMWVTTLLQNYWEPKKCGLLSVVVLQIKRLRREACLGIWKL